MERRALLKWCDKLSLMIPRATAAPPLFPEPTKKALCHPSRPEKAKGMCQACYRADLKAKTLAKELEGTKATNDDKNENAVVRDLEKDPAVKARFLQIMWEWLEAPQNVPECWDVKDGKKVRDWETQARLQEVAQRKADKAATVLGRAYVVEKREEVKPVALPLGKEIDDSGWEDAPSTDDEESDEPSE